MDTIKTLVTETQQLGLRKLTSDDLREWVSVHRNIPAEKIEKADVAQLLLWMREFKLTVVQGNLFDAPQNSVFVQCISADFAMGKGIAVEFNKRFNVKRKITAAYPCNNWNCHGYCLPCGNTMELVTKEHYWGKPTPRTLRESLVDLKNKLSPEQTFLVMPKIGCGLDRLEWTEVEKMIREVFSDTCVQITVYGL